MRIEFTTAGAIALLAGTMIITALATASLANVEQADQTYSPLLYPHQINEKPIGHQCRALFKDASDNALLVCSNDILRRYKNTQVFSGVVILALAGILGGVGLYRRRNDKAEVSAQPAAA